MADGHKLLAPQRGKAPERKISADPKLDMASTWVKAEASADIRERFRNPVPGELFIRILSELKTAGLDVVEDILTEPLEGYKVVACAEVYHKAGNGARNPEEVGMVSLYSKGDAPSIVKLSPWAAGCSGVLIDAFSRAVESLIGSASPAEGSEISIKVHSGFSPDFD